MVKIKFPDFFIVRAICCFLLFAGSFSAAKAELTKRPEVREFINHMVAKYQFDNNELTKLLNKARIQKRIIEIISKPAESKPWYEYRPIFMTSKRIADGVEFWEQNKETLERAFDVYGVPPQIITAILGVETFYGRQKGGYRMLDSLATLAFDYPPRSKFFTSELEQYLLMTREEKIDPLTMKGSYAGAMGKAQFISSSYRQYAVDFDNDGKRDLWNNNADAIGSIAHYLNVHGWKKGQPVASKAEVDTAPDVTLLNNNLKPDSSVGLLKKNGVRIEDAVSDDEQATLISLETKTEPEYWVGYYNFYVISRYNHSALYAMVVYQLSEEILAEGTHNIAALIR